MLIFLKKRFKCLTGHGRCAVEHKTSRKCYRCRLERCFAMGMRKDLILSQQEIQRRRDSSRNRTMPAMDRVGFFVRRNDLISYFRHTWI